MMATKRNYSRKESLRSKLRNNIVLWKLKALQDFKRPLKEKLPLTEEIITSMKEFIDMHHIRAKSFFHQRNFKGVIVKDRWTALINKLEDTDVLIQPIWQYLMEELIGVKDDQGLMDFKHKLFNKCILYAIGDIKKTIKGREDSFKEDVRREKDIIALARNLIEKNQPNEAGEQNRAVLNERADHHPPLSSDRGLQTRTKKEVTRDNEDKKEDTNWPITPRNHNAYPYIQKHDTSPCTSKMEVDETQRPEPNQNIEESVRGVSGSTNRSKESQATSTDTGCQADFAPVEPTKIMREQTTMTDVGRPEVMHREVTCDIDQEHTEINLQMSKRIHDYEITIQNIKSNMEEVHKRLRQLRWGETDIGETDTTNKEILIEEATKQLTQIEQQITLTANEVSNENEKGTEIDRLHNQIRSIKSELKSVKSEKKKFQKMYDDEQLKRMEAIEKLELETKEHKEKTKQYEEKIAEDREKMAEDRNKIAESCRQMTEMYNDLKMYQSRYGPPPPPSPPPSPSPPPHD